MIEPDIRSLLKRLNPHCVAALEGAAHLASSRGAYEVAPEHLLQAIVEPPDGDVGQILRAAEIDPDRVLRSLAIDLEGTRTGNTGRPVWSPLLRSWIADAWLVGSVDLGASFVRTGHLLLALLKSRGRYDGEAVRILSQVPSDSVAMNFAEVTAASTENENAEQLPDASAARPAGGGAVRSGSGEGDALSRFTIDVTAQARDGAVDPVFGRDREVRQMVDILARRRKNNPIIVGEPGVGKTALIEGLALETASGTAPESLRGIRLLTLDMGLLQAGAGVKGEFENRLNHVIKEVKASEVPIVLFIDEAHTLIGAGGAQGGGDAANLLKPALARGELRTVAATTWSEYKKYFEKDPALSRRFQLVKVDEPDAEGALGMLRGIAPQYERAHGVRIFDEAVEACAKLGSRYIAGRQHPDKGVDLLDTAAARVKIAHTALPPKIEELEQARAKAQRTLAALVKDDQVGRPTDAIRIQDLEAEIERLQGEVDSNRAIWDQERELVAAVIEARAELDSESEPDEVDSDTSADGPSPVALEDVQARLEAFREEHGTLIPLDVDAEVVARVIADWTGIPVGNMVRDEARSVLEFEDRMQARIKGQDHALAALGRAIRASKAGVGDPEAPIGVFLAVGTSGVGKTECGLGLADLLFGGSRFLTTINMSEFGEKHTVSRLIGSPPGYVGYGEGGRLTEAVRKAPYSVVLLDEVEKADPEVMNLFYQVFDKGTLSDGEGREVDFKNTILYMTSNLGTDVITQMCADGAVPTIEELREALHPVLAAHFKPALLARMSVVPFLPIGSEIMSDITRLKLDKVVRRVRDVHGLVLEYSDEVVERIVAQCTQVDTGARNIDHILRGSFMPELSTELLARMADDEIGTRCQVGVGNELAFTFDFTDA